MIASRLLASDSSLCWGLYKGIYFETLLSRPRTSIIKSYYRNLRIVQSNNRNKNIRIVGWNGSQEQTKTKSTQEDFEINMPLSRIVCHCNFRIILPSLICSIQLFLNCFVFGKRCFLLFTMKLSFNTEWLIIRADYRDK